jgi:Icc-related predicted phosphoesterase
MPLPSCFAEEMPLKLVIVSDTHGRHESLGVLSGDVLIHCGDFGVGGTDGERSIAELDSWFSRQNFRLILCTGGNHDFVAEELRSMARPVFRHARLLQDEAATLDGVVFYGAPWVPELASWAHYLDNDDIRRAWMKIPENVGVLITHTPPRGILDRNSSGKECGCPHLRDRLRELRPAVHCFGHIHASAGAVEVGGTRFVNASIVNSRYQVVCEPTVIQL